MHISLYDISIIDLLEADPRPSFIVALAPQPPTVLYANPAFSGRGVLLSLVSSSAENFSPLWQWITEAPSPLDSGDVLSPAAVPAPSFLYSGVYWTRFMVNEQLIVVGENEQMLQTGPARIFQSDVSQVQAPASSSRLIIPLEPATLNSAALETAPICPSSSPDERRSRSLPVTIPISLKDRQSCQGEPVQSLSQGRSASDPGWILPDTTPEQRPFLDVINSVNWAQTPLGPMYTWHPKLRETVNQILVDSRPIAIYWGPSYTTIYNEAFSKICGAKHPAMLGMPVQEAWNEAGHRLKEIMRAIPPNHRGRVEDEWRFFVERESEAEGDTPWLEETYLKWSIIPIIENNECLGFMHPVAETTSLRLWERRMKMLIDLGEALLTARDVESYWEKTIQELAAVEPRSDVPLAILYIVENSQDPPGTPTLNSSSVVCRLAGTLGVPTNHPIAPQTLDLQSDSDALSLAFRKALSARHPILLQTKDGTLPRDLLKGLQWRAFGGDPCRAAVICPIRPTKNEAVMGLLLLGLNPRCPYDNDYRQHIALLSQKLATSLASIVLLEEETRRGRNAAEEAAYDKAMLKEKLAMQTKEATESMQMFEAVAEFVPVGMAFGDPQGEITYANDSWYKITGYPKTDRIEKQGFISCVKDEDRPVVIVAYEKLKTAGNVQFEFRVKRPASNDGQVYPVTPPSFEKTGLDLVSVDDMTERHVMATARAEYGVDGNVIRILTCLTDVTAHKRAAEEAVRRAQQAENLKRMAEFATVGLYDVDLEGRLLGANDVFFELCGLEKVDPTEVDVRPWKSCVCEEDYSLLTEKLARMVKEDKVQTVEVRLNTTWTADDGSGHKVVVPRCVQATLMPVKSNEGVITSFTGCLSDISLQKWQLDWEKERKEEALESKRQQENFIDMTSHEMRNPLSAIIHCADAITATLTRVEELLDTHARRSEAGSRTDHNKAESAINATKLEDGWRTEARDLVESSIDNAETIVSCAQHQKRIVDDILTMSKLDSNLLGITPIIVDPIKMVQEALKMFEVEARRVDINLSMIVDPAYRELGIKYLEFDPSRLKQVLINLLTNALKFTKTGPTRNVSVTISASLTRPTEATSKVQFIPRSQDTVNSDQGNQLASKIRGSPVFLMFEVKDTGEGLTEEEKKSLFQRFVQASSRTHVKYGGSGLGLFISRRLTELQNGAIGVASQPGVGSTFGFYIETRIPSSNAIQEAEASAAVTRKARGCHPVLDISSVSLQDKAICTRKRAGTSSTLSDSTTPTSNGSIFDHSSVSPIATPISECAHPLPEVSTPQIRGVLVVEDNLINQQITRRGLLSMGFTVDVANHGLECLEKLRRTDRFIQAPDDTDEEPQTGDDATPRSSTHLLTSNPPLPLSSSTPSTSHDFDQQLLFPLSMILMDIEMPVQDGLTCTRRIRELERAGRIRGGRIPIIAVSANARMEQIAEARQAGCDDVLVKPYRMPELLEKMRLVMGCVAAGGGLLRGGEED